MSKLNSYQNVLVKIVSDIRLLMALIASSYHQSSRDVCVLQILWDIDGDLMSPDIVTSGLCKLLALIEPCQGGHIKEMESSSVG